MKVYFYSSKCIFNEMQKCALKLYDSLLASIPNKIIIKD